jgi:vacuolar-type H+-ATPase subunit E/Vma4
MAVETLLQTLEQAATAQADHTLAEARARAEALVRDATVDAERRRALVLDEVRARARLASDRAFAEATRALKERLLSARTAVVAQVLARAGARLSTLEGSAYPWRIEPLVESTLAYLAGAPAALSCRPDVAARVEAASAGRGEIEISASPEAAAGVLGRSADGRVTVDNTLVALLERRRPELAIAIARRIEEGADALGRPE